MLFGGSLLRDTIYTCSLCHWKIYLGTLDTHDYTFLKATMVKQHRTILNIQYNPKWEKGRDRKCRNGRKIIQTNLKKQKILTKINSFIYTQFCILRNTVKNGLACLWHDSACSHLMFQEGISLHKGQGCRPKLITCELESLRQHDIKNRYSSVADITTWARGYLGETGHALKKKM